MERSANISIPDELPTRLLERLLYRSFYIEDPIERLLYGGSSIQRLLYKLL